MQLLYIFFFFFFFKAEDGIRDLTVTGVQTCALPICNRQKVESAVSNARALLEFQEKEGSFDAFLWEFVGGAPKQNARRSLRQLPARTRESDRMSESLVSRGFRFVGPTICYAFMQAVGMVNDHLVTCFRHAELQSPVANATK